MFAKVKKGTISKALGEAKKTVVSKAKQVTKEVTKELQGNNKNNNSNNKAAPMVVLPAAPPVNEPKQEEDTKALVENASTDDKSQTTPTKPENVTPKDDPNNNNIKNDDATNTDTTTTPLEALPPGAKDTIHGIVDVVWNKRLLDFVNDRRAQLETPLPAITWSDCIYEQCLPVAQSNSETGLNKYGDKVQIKAAIKQVHKACKGTFKVTTQTMDLTNTGSTDEALQNFIDSSGHWGMLINPENKMGAFAAVQNGNRVYWVGIFIKLWPNRPNE